MIELDAIEDLLLLAGFPPESSADVRENRAIIRAVLAEVGDAEPHHSGGYDPVEVMQKIIGEGADDPSSFWRTHLVRTGRCLVSELCGSGLDRRPDLRRLPPTRFTVTFRRSFVPHDRHGRTGRLRIPSPVQDAHLRELSIEPAPGCDAVELVTAPGRLEAKWTLNPGRPVTLGARYTFTALPQLRHATERPDQRWLQPVEGGALVTQTVRGLAKTYDPGGDDLTRLLNFRDHLLDEFTCAPLAYERQSAAPIDDAISERRFDCRLGSMLLVALCRASGIPARLVGGYLLWDAPMEHFWMEAWIDRQGWTPIDLLAWDLSAGGRDAAWRDIYVGALDYRMKTQVLPDIFTGAPGVPLPAAWRRLTRRVEGGVVSSLASATDGTTIYSDEISVVKA